MPSKRRQPFLFDELSSPVATGFGGPVLGFVGKLWTTSGDFLKLEAREFREFAMPGFAKVAWNFTLTRSEAGRTHLATESRVQCLDEASSRKFQRYFFFMGPVSSLTRQSALRAFKRQAEG